MKDFYINKIGLEFISEERRRHVFLKAGKNMLLIFNPENTSKGENNIFPAHGAITPPACIHFALEIEKPDYEDFKKMLIQNKIDIEREITWVNEHNNNSNKSIYFRDPAGNLVEFITADNWPVEN